MTEGWKCPNCGKAHGPHVDTCPEPGGLAPTFPPYRPRVPGTIYDPPTMWPPYTTCGDPAVGLGRTRVTDPVSGRDLGPSD
jgi:hypothetical protein